MLTLHTSTQQTSTSTKQNNFKNHFNVIIQSIQTISYNTERILRIRSPYTTSINKSNQIKQIKSIKTKQTSTIKSKQNKSIQKTISIQTISFNTEHIRSICSPTHQQSTLLNFSSNSFILLSCASIFLHSSCVADTFSV